METLQHQKKALAYAIAEYLANELAGVDDDMKESLEGKLPQPYTNARATGCALRRRRRAFVAWRHLPYRKAS
jgi:hypothetical protein